MTTISVIIPAYNAERTIETSVASVLNGTYPAVEVLVVDDGSTDGTAELVRALMERDSRVHLLIKENGGVSSARNYGLDHATGDVIMFLDADDTYEPDYCERVALEMEESHADIVLSGYTIEYPSKQETVLCPVSELHSSEEIYTELIEKHYMSGLNGYIGSVCMAAFRRSLILETGIRFHTGIHHGEDKLFLVQYLFCCKTLYTIPTVMYRYVLKGESATKKYSPDISQNNSLLQSEWEKLLAKYGKACRPDQTGRSAVSDLFSLLANETRAGNPKLFLQQLRFCAALPGAYADKLRDFHPDSRGLKIKTSIARSPLLCMLYYLFRRLQRALGGNY